MLNYKFENREYSAEELKSIFEKVIPDGHIDVLYAFLEENFESMGEKEQLIWSRVMEIFDKDFYNNEELSGDN